jgi:two-component system nitrogen regulation response regulator GlnG
MAPGQLIEINDLPSDVREQTPREAAGDWQAALALEADRMLATREPEVFEKLNRSFERTLIARALAASGGRRIEASQMLGIGRNTITRKIQELGIEGAKLAEPDEDRA